jgi:hypothetical protein
MKLFICGHARSGKDYAGEYLRKVLRISFDSSSYCAIKHFLYDKLKDEYGFTSVDDCFNRRHEEGMRKRLFDEICAFNNEDPTALSAVIFAENDAYVGIRNYVELEAAKKRWPDAFVIWIDASGRVPPESIESCTISKDQADIIIENDGTVEEFDDKLSRLCRFIISCGKLRQCQKC